MPLVIMTGASGSGKTAIAQTIRLAKPSITVFGFDSIGVPSAEIMASYGGGHQPGGAWQRAMTMEWIKRIAPSVNEGRAVLFEGQMRIAFICEALDAVAIAGARIVLLDCDDASRRMRLIHPRQQPELANESMMGWAAFLRQEAQQSGSEILDTTRLSLTESTDAVLSIFSRLGI
jgi:hypothetical protein